MHRSPSQCGFSLVEVIVVAAIAAVLAAIAVPLLRAVRTTADLRTSFVGTATAVKRKATAAVGGRANTFCVERDAMLSPGLTVNPASIPPPPGTEQVTEITFEGGTGNARVGGRRAVVSIVIAEEGSADRADAIVAGAGGRVELKTYLAGRWEEFR